MFSFPRALILGLVALPLTAATIHDVQVGADGQLAFSPEAIVSVLLTWPWNSYSWMISAGTNRRSSGLSFQS